MLDKVKQKFEVGDRVVCISEWDGKRSIVGVAGTVRGHLDDTIYQIEYDRDIGGHGLSRGMNVPRGHGWNTDSECLIYEDDPSLEHDNGVSFEEVMNI